MKRQTESTGNRYSFLTNLPSMTYFFELAEEARDAYIEQGDVPVFLFMDLSGMKFFNTKFGFSAGDMLLLAFARVLRETFGSEACCHIGADHFAAFTSEDGLEERLTAFLGKCKEINEGNSLPVHIGIYSNRMGRVAASTACDRAKFACDQLRNSFESRFNYYDKGLGDDAVLRRYILSHLDRALEENWITVYYQPIVRAVNGRVCDEEALARWNDPEQGRLSPDSFIPYLEDANLIYKLDLYILERVLEKMAKMEAQGLYMVPHSINLSRSDFDTCDIVEEVRRRVDAAGISHDKITIEITESTIGSAFEYMKTEILRFQSLGFPVWMDDFGSGYSSVEMLQRIKFDLIKFDMGFLKRLNEGNAGKIILTQLLKMATSLGMDTVCEGVETEEQVRFLRAVGCAKLQGYYYCRPIPLEVIYHRYKTGTQIGFENPDEAAYYEAMGRINLYDLSFVANRDEHIFRSTFETLPMGVIEFSPEGEHIRFARSNESFRFFLKKYFGVNLSDEMIEYAVPRTGQGSLFIEKVGKCRKNGERVFIEEKASDGSTVNSFARRVGVNPVTGRISVVVAVLSISEPDEGTTYASIARALAADFYNLYYVDLASGDFIKYSSSVGGTGIAVEKRGKSFFEAARIEALTRIYRDDQERFLNRFTKEKILGSLDESGVFNITYRQMDSGTPCYVRMKITRMEDDADHIIVGISIIESEMKRREEEDRLRQERVLLERMAALSASYIVLYTIDPATDHYIQYNPSSEFARFGLAKRGEDFFGDVRRDALKAIDPADLERHMRVMTKENMMREIRENRVFIHRYGLMIDGVSIPVSLRAALINEDGVEKIILGVSKA